MTSTDLSPLSAWDQPGTSLAQIEPVIEGTFEDLGEDIAESPATAQQLIILVSDGSSSMNFPLRTQAEAIPGVPPQTKAAAAEVAMMDLIARLQDGRKKNDFWLSFVAFHNQVSVARKPAKLTELPITDSYSPTQAGTGGTCVYAALEAAAATYEEFRRSQPSELQISAVTTAFSDGMCSNPQRTMEAAARLKAMPGMTVAACLFAAEGQEAGPGSQLLRAVASGPEFYSTSHNADQLRDFFMRSISLAK